MNDAAHRQTKGMLLPLEHVDAKRCGLSLDARRLDQSDGVAVAQQVDVDEVAVSRDAVGAQSAQRYHTLPVGVGAHDAGVTIT